MNPETGEISLNLDLNSKTGEKSPDWGVHVIHCTLGGRAAAGFSGRRPALDRGYVFDVLLDNPAMKALLTPRMVTHGLTSVRACCAVLLRYTNAGTVTQITCPAFAADNETGEVSPGWGKVLSGHLTCPKQFRLFTKADGTDRHYEGMAPIASPTLPKHRGEVTAC